MTVGNPLKLSAMHYRHLALGATMIDEGGWQRPARYTDSQTELERLQERVGLCDISPVGKLYLQGTEAGRLLEERFPGTAAGTVGRVGQHTLLDGDGSVLDNVLLCRLADDHLFIVTSPNRAGEAAGSLEQRLSGSPTVDMSSAFAAMSVAGPRSRETLAKLTELDLSTEAFPDLSCAQVSLALVHATILRTDCGGQLCYELYVARDLGEYIWDAIVEAGRELDLSPFGVEALQRLCGGG